MLLLAWIAWAIYVTSSNGATAGLGVVLAWPAMLVALALISLPFIGGYLLIRRLSDGDGSPPRRRPTRRRLPRMRTMTPRRRHDWTRTARKRTRTPEESEDEETEEAAEKASD